MPVVTVQEVWTPIRIGSACQICRDPAEQGETAIIIGPIAAVWPGVRVARPIIEGRMVDEIGQAVAAGQPCQTHPHPLGGKGRRQPGSVGETRKRIEKAAKTRHRRARPT